MMQVAFGVETWTKGIRNYLKTMKFASASSADLYQGIQNAVNEDHTSPIDIATIMGSWENQAGYPVVTVSRHANALTLTQERFYYTNDTSDSVWWVPINYVVGSNPDFAQAKPDLWMPGQKTVTINNAYAPKKFTADDWIVVNIQESSYYRVNYDESLWNLLIKQLNGNDYLKISAQPCPTR